MHKEPHIFAGKRVILHTSNVHPQLGSLDGSFVTVEDLWDKLTGHSWMFSDGNPACLIYALRSTSMYGGQNLPVDDDVVYTKFKGLGVLIHNSEILSG